MARNRRLHPLARRRLAVGLTTQEFADKLEVSRQSVALWESGKGCPSPGMYPRIADILGISALEVTELMHPSDVSEPSAA